MLIQVCLTSLICCLGILFSAHFHSRRYRWCLLSFGKLLPDVAEPGIHFKWFWPITKSSLVDVRPQVDEIKDIACVSVDKLSIVFPNVRVFNQLKKQHVFAIVTEFGECYDHYLIIEQVRVKIVEMCTMYLAEDLYTKKFASLNEEIFEYLKQIQDVHNSALAITHVSVDKLILPSQVMANYERVGIEKAQTEAEQQSQQRQIMQYETAHKLQIMETKNKIEIRQMEADTRSYELDKNTTSQVDSIRRIAEANKERFTPEYIQLEAISKWGNIQKLIYFGNAIPPSMLMTNITGF